MCKQNAADQFPGDYLGFLDAARTVLEKYGIGWTMWDYSGGFAIVLKKDGAITIDELTVKALGLKIPPATPSPHQ